MWQHRSHLTSTRTNSLPNQVDVVWHMISADQSAQRKRAQTSECATLLELLVPISSEHEVQLESWSIVTVAPGYRQAGQAPELL